MKIALYGNVCNNMLAIAKAVRTHSIHQADLFLPDNIESHNLPENDYPEYRVGYPDWIRKSPAHNLRRNINVFSRTNICREFSNYDIVILSSFNVALAPFIKNAQTIFFVTGGDLTVLPFAKTHRALMPALPLHSPKPEIYQWLQRRGIRAVDGIITQPFSPFVNALERLSIDRDKIIDAYFPILLDTDRFRWRKDALSRLSPSDKVQFERFLFRIFHPSRIMIDGHPALMNAGQLKRNDMLVHAFAEFVKASGAKDAGLYLISFHGGQGKETIALKRLIHSLGIENQVVWLEPENPRGYTRDAIMDLYSLADLVADDFGAGWFGSICVEGFCCSKPVLSYVDEEAMTKLYSWHPFLSSNTVEGNRALIEKVYSDRTFARIQGELGRKWAEEFHSISTSGTRYIREIEKIVDRYQ